MFRDTYAPEIDCSQKDATNDKFELTFIIKQLNIIIHVPVGILKGSITYDQQTCSMSDVFPYKN